jgi:hypothetical protein
VYPKITIMSRLEALQPNAAVRGILPDCLVTVVNVQWFGSDALEFTYKTPAGKVANELLYRHDEPRIEVAEQGRPWSFDGEDALGSTRWTSRISCAAGSRRACSSSMPRRCFPGASPTPSLTSGCIPKV